VTAAGISRFVEIARSDNFIPDEIKGRPSFFASRQMKNALAATAITSTINQIVANARPCTGRLILVWSFR
jgi:hypothetical protein